MERKERKRKRGPKGGNSKSPWLLWRGEDPSLFFLRPAVVVYVAIKDLGGGEEDLTRDSPIFNSTSEQVLRF